jgi:hypothetical protein
MAKELLPENEKPLNQLSKKALSGLKLRPSPNDLYVLQLMLWVLREKRGLFVRDNYPDLLDAVEYLQYQEPKSAMLLLLQDNRPENQGLFPAENLEKENLKAEDLTFHLVEQLHLLLSIDDLGYPIKKLQSIFPLT